MFPLYRVLIHRGTPEPTLMLGLEPTDVGVEPRLYVRLENLPLPGQVLVIRALWSKHAFDVREAMSQPHAVIYLDASALGDLTDGAFTAVERVVSAGCLN